MKVLAAVDHHRLAGDEVGAGPQRKTTAPTTSSGTWSRWIVRAATETSRSCLDHLGMRLARPSLIVKPGATQLTWMLVLAELLRERARERDDRALRAST